MRPLCQSKTSPVGTHGECLVGGRPLRQRLQRQGLNGDGRTDRASLQDSVSASLESYYVRIGHRIDFARPGLPTIIGT